MDKTDVRKILSRNVKVLVKKQLKHKTELAQKTKSHPKTIYDIWDGHGNPKIQTLETIAKALRVPPWTLLVTDFPFNALNTNNRGLTEISSQGYELLSAFEKAEKDQQQQAMRYLSFLIEETNIKASNRLKESASYYTRPVSLKTEV